MIRRFPEVSNSVGVTRECQQIELAEGLSDIVAMLEITKDDGLDFPNLDPGLVERLPADEQGQVVALMPSAPADWAGNSTNE